MVSWKDVVASEPEFAARAQALFDAHLHKTLATLRKDGSPRISGTEARFDDGEIWLGMMGGSRKALDLRRDPRLALHSATVTPPDDPTAWEGDAKIAGRAVEIDDPDTIQAFTNEPAGSSHLFRVDVTEVVVTRVGDPPDHLIIEAWHPDRGLRRIERK
jgi:hypothetical protein